MKPYRCLLGLERLEDRFALATLAESTGPLSLLSAEDTVSALPIAEVTAPMAEIAGITAANMGHRFTLSIDTSATGNVLHVQFEQLAEAKIVAIAGGASVWTNAEGEAQLSLPPHEPHVELLIGDNRLVELMPFLRIEFDQDGRIANYESIAQVMPAVPDLDMTGMAMELMHAFDAVHANSFGVHDPTIFSGSAVAPGHHAYESATVLAGNAPNGSTLSLHDTGEHGAERAMTTGMGQAGMNSSTSATLQAADMNVAAMVLANNAASESAEHAPEAESSAWPLESGAEAMIDETVESLIAGWTAGGQPDAREILRPAIAATLPSDSPSLADLAPSTPPVSAVETIASHLVGPAAVAEPEGASKLWPAIGGIIVAAISVAGVIALERRAIRVAASDVLDKLTSQVSQAGTPRDLPALKVAG